MDEPEWLTLEDVLAAHARQQNVFGGASGIRDENALSSALSPPLDKWQYEGLELADLAAAYAFGIARHHPFIDGYKRAGFVAMLAFLVLNGVAFAPDPVEETAVVLGLAAGEIDETGLARWIRDSWPAA